MSCQGQGEESKDDPRCSLQTHLRQRSIVINASVCTPDQPELKSVLRSPEKRRAPVGRIHSDRSDPDSPRKVRTTSPQRQRRVLLLRKEISERAVPVRQKNERIGNVSLRNIADHKSSIAEMRPARRKIRWNMAGPDTEKCPTSGRTRIPGLNIGDLSFHGCSPFGEKTDQERLEAEIQRLEQSIRRCFQSIERVKKEAEKDKELAEHIREENRELRRKLIAIPVPKNQSIRQAQRQLESTIGLLKAKLDDFEDEEGILARRNSKDESLSNEDVYKSGAVAAFHNSSPCLNMDDSAGESDASRAMPILMRKASVFSPRSRRAPLPKSSLRLTTKKKPRESPRTPRRRIRSGADKKKKLPPSIPVLENETLNLQLASVPAAA